MELSSPLPLYSLPSPFKSRSLGCAETSVILMDWKNEVCSSNSEHSQLTVFFSSFIKSKRATSVRLVSGTFPEKDPLSNSSHVHIKTSLYFLIRAGNRILIDWEDCCGNIGSLTTYTKADYLKLSLYYSPIMKCDLTSLCATWECLQIFYVILLHFLLNLFCIRNGL